MESPFKKNSYSTFLAPMQDITDAKFMKTIAMRGCPDFFAAEYFRIHEYYEFEPRVLEAVLSKPCGRHVAAQFIGEDTRYIQKATAELQKLGGVEILDLNLGCPAPKIYRKNVGGGLLRDPEKITEILRVMRGEWGGTLSVKMRLGFESSDEFKPLFERVLAENPDYITIHARTVKQLYRGIPDFAPVKWAVENSPVPIVANGDIDCARAALDVFGKTGCAAVMCGRGAVRNPWIFRQIKDSLEFIFKMRAEIAEGKTDFSAITEDEKNGACEASFSPTLADVRSYVDSLFSAMTSDGVPLWHADSCLKKYLNFVGTSVDSNGEFLRKMRLARGAENVLKICDEFMLNEERGAKLFPKEPFRNLCSRPNHEA